MVTLEWYIKSMGEAPIQFTATMALLAFAVIVIRGLTKNGI